MRINTLIFSRPLGLVMVAGMIPGGDRSPRVQVFRETDGEAGACFLRKAGFPATPEFRQNLLKKVQAKWSLFRKLTSFFRRIALFDRSLHISSLPIGPPILPQEVWVS
jgi:hypothetical protein